MQEELLTFGREFTRAVAANDVAAIGQFVADDWVIVDADGGVIDRLRFLNAIESGHLSHESMESTDGRDPSPAGSRRTGSQGFD